MLKLLSRLVGQYGIKYGTDIQGSKAAVFKPSGRACPPMQLDLPEEHTQSEAVTWETMVGDRQMAVLVKERELSTTCEACKA